MINIRKLKTDEIECRVAQVSAKGCSLLLYKTARIDRAILDETYGDLWQNDFKVIDGKMYGGIGIYNKELQQWLWRWDCGTESNTEEEKGQASDCFKRAGFKWGIGIELYSAPFIWLNIETEQNGKGKWQLKDKYAKFYVSSIDYSDNGNINNLVITDSYGKQVYPSKQKNAGSVPENKSKSKGATADDAGIYIALAKIEDIETLKSYYNLNKEKVNDKKALYDMVQRRLEAIKKIKAEFGEVD